MLYRLESTCFICIEGHRVKYILQSMKVISFYTNEKYRQQAQELKRSAEALGMECILFERPDLGTWWQNCNQKSQVVLKALQEFAGEAVLWCDADARILKYPKLLLELEADMAAFFSTTSIPIGGTLWFNGAKALRYAEAWADTVEKHPEREDDSINFREALQNIKQPNIHHLPPSYCWNEPTMRNAYPGVKEPVIIHSYVGKHDYPSNDRPAP